MKATLIEIHRAPYYPKGSVYPRGETKRIVRRIELEANTENELLKKAYQFQRQLRYCNDNWVEFEDEELERKFRGYRPTIEEYYGGGVVD